MIWGGWPGYLGEIVNFVSFLSFQYHDKIFFVYVKVICFRDKFIPVSVRLSEFNCFFDDFNLTLPSLFHRSEFLFQMRTIEIKELFRNW